MRDLASVLCKIEVLPLDEWGAMTDSYDSETGPEVDELMDQPAELRRVYDDHLSVPTSMISRSRPPTACDSNRGLRPNNCEQLDRREMPIQSDPRTNVEMLFCAAERRSIVTESDVRIWQSG